MEEVSYGGAPVPVPIMEVLLYLKIRAIAIDCTYLDL